MVPSSVRRSAEAIRLDFKIAVAHVTYRAAMPLTVEALWDEANNAATEVIHTLAADDYLRVLWEITRWESERRIALARNRMRG